MVNCFSLKKVNKKKWQNPEKSDIILPVKRVHLLVHCEIGKKYFILNLKKKSSSEQLNLVPRARDPFGKRHGSTSSGRNRLFLTSDWLVKKKKKNRRTRQETSFCAEPCYPCPSQGKGRLNSVIFQYLHCEEACKSSRYLPV